MTTALAIVGRGTRETLGLIGNLSILTGALLLESLRLPRLNLRVVGKVMLSQIRFSGLDAVPLIAVIATLIGAVSIIQAFGIVSGLADDLIGPLLVSIIVRELGPLITAVILISRSGSAMAAELGSMQLGGEIEVLRAHRIDPLSFIFLPRVYAAVLSMFALMVVFDLMGVLGGFAVAVMLKDISFTLLQAKVLAALTNADFVFHVLKAFLFGTAIAGLSCYFGMRVQRSTTELPQAVTKAVVSSLAAVFVLDSILAFAFYVVL